MESRLVIKSGRVIDPANNIDEILDIRVENGVISEIGKDLSFSSDDIVVDAKGKWITPGLVDIHVHFRDPGFTYKEDIETGSRAAAFGGFTTVVTMANTNPVADNEVVIEYQNAIANKKSLVNIFPAGAVTKELKGETLSEIGKMKEAGIVAITDDGVNIDSPSVFKNAMKYAKFFDLPILVHAEDKRLTGKGQIGAGKRAKELGLASIPPEAEEIIIARDIILAKSENAHIHIQHLSSEGSVNLIRRAKEDGVKITTEVCPHHFTLTESDIPDYDTNYKMAPPLRTEKDRQALLEGLRDGTIDIIATDHAPHSPDDKNKEFELAPNGIIGLETSLALSLELVHQNVLTESQLIEKMSLNPSNILNLKKGTLGIGFEADITIIDPNLQWTFGQEHIQSKSRNTPFIGRKFKGKVITTIVKGKIVYMCDDAQTGGGTF